MNISLVVFILFLLSIGIAFIGIQPINMIVGGALAFALSKFSNDHRDYLDFGDKLLILTAMISLFIGMVVPLYDR